MRHRGHADAAGECTRTMSSAVRSRSGLHPDNITHSLAGPQRRHHIRFVRPYDARIVSRSTEKITLYAACALGHPSYEPTTAPARQHLRCCFRQFNTRTRAKILSQYQTMHAFPSCSLAYTVVPSCTSEVDPLYRTAVIWRK